MKIRPLALQKKVTAEPLPSIFSAPSANSRDSTFQTCRDFKSCQVCIGSHDTIIPNRGQRVIGKVRLLDPD